MGGGWDDPLLYAAACFGHFTTMICHRCKTSILLFSICFEQISHSMSRSFYQKKSILDVTKNLIESTGFDLKLVGVMILCFFCHFPLIKLVLGVFLQYPMFARQSFCQEYHILFRQMEYGRCICSSTLYGIHWVYGLFRRSTASTGKQQRGFAIGRSIIPICLPAHCFYLLPSSIVLGLLINKWHTGKASTAVTTEVITKI